MGKLGNVIITENIVGPWKLGGGLCLRVQEALFKKKKKIFFFRFYFIFSFRLEMEPFAVMLSQLK